MLASVSLMSSAPGAGSGTGYSLICQGRSQPHAARPRDLTQFPQVSPGFSRVRLAHPQAHSVCLTQVYPGTIVRSRQALAEGEDLQRRAAEDARAIRFAVTRELLLHEPQRVGVSLTDADR